VLCCRVGARAFTQQRCPCEDNGRVGGRASQGGGCRSKLERPTSKVSDLLLGPLPSRAWLADHLEKAVGCHRVELEARHEVEAKLEAL
jgi:hypothetical protein